MRDAVPPNKEMPAKIPKPPSRGVPLTTDVARARGVVQRLLPERGFGFIRCTQSLQQTDIGQDFFFHLTGLADMSIAELMIGDLVSFEPREVAKGLRAEHVERA